MEFIELLVQHLPSKNHQMVPSKFTGDTPSKNPYNKCVEVTIQYKTNRFLHCLRQGAPSKNHQTQISHHPPSKNHTQRAF